MAPAISIPVAMSALLPFAVEVDFSTMPAEKSGAYPQHYHLQFFLETASGEATGADSKCHGMNADPATEYRSMLSDLKWFTGWEFVAEPGGRKLVLMVRGKRGSPVVKVHRKSLGPEPEIRWVVRPPAEKK